jgi:RND family efflux transporter MFP subunit
MTYWANAGSTHAPARGAGREHDAAPARRASLTVTSITPRSTEWPTALAADGSVAAWQEAIIGSELGGLQLADVLVNVGDVVKRGQVLARFASEGLAADLAQHEALADGANAALAEAAANADRARALFASGMISAQQSTQALTAERSARARLLSAQASVRADQIRLAQARVVAPDDGVISSRHATIGSVASPGMELFRLIRQSRLEWRAEVTSADLERVRPGQPVALTGANGVQVGGRVRMIAPTIDPVSRKAIIYVDLPAPCGLRAGMFATGQFELGRAPALTVPQRAVVTRDGHDLVYRIVAGDKVVQTRVTLGRRLADQVEILNGADPTMTLVDQGAGLLDDGDTVKVVAAPRELTLPTE